MDHLFSAFMSKRASSDSRQYSSCGDIPDLYTKKKRPQKGALFSDNRPTSPSSDRHVAKCMSNSELVNIVDAQLIQIRERLATLREQDIEFRERMDLLSDSVSELASQSSLSSFSLSDCSDLDWLDEASEEKEESEQQTAGPRTLSNEPQLLCIPTVRVTNYGDHFNQPLEICFHMRRAISDPTSIHKRHVELLKEELATQSHCGYSADQTINLYPQYNNPEEMSTLF